MKPAVSQRKKAKKTPVDLAAEIFGGEEIIEKTPPQEVESGDITINPEKSEIFDKIESTKNHFFITGKAGTGKSHLLKFLKLNSKKQIVVCAPTGVAALNVGGQTLHSFFKIPPNFINPEDVRLSPKVAEILHHVEVLVLDEVSMIRAEMIDIIDHLLKQAREPFTPFGGVQLIMFGDPFQLPPVVNSRELQEYFAKNHGGFHFFNAHVWEDATFETYELQEIFRQKDNHFIQILNRVRTGDIDQSLLDTLNRRVELFDEDSPTIILSTTNSKVNFINTNKLAGIDSKEFIFEADISGVLDEKQYPADEILKLKKGAQIMMLKNDPDDRWVNGSLGTIESLSEKNIEVNIGGSVYPVAPVSWNKINYFYNRETKKVEEQIVGNFVQYPIRLAWAITIHKSQGQTFDRVIIDLDSGAFTSGQVYVALSRCRSLPGIYLTRPIRKEDIKVDVNVSKFMEKKHQP